MIEAPSVSQLSEVISHAIAPAFMLGAVSGFISVLVTRLNRIIADQTGQPIKKVEKDTERNFWMTAEAAKEYGLVGKIIASADELKR